MHVLQHTTTAPARATRHPAHPPRFGELVRLMSDCWKQESGQRPSFEDVMLRLRPMLSEQARGGGGGDTGGRAPTFAAGPADP